MNTTDPHKLLQHTWASVIKHSLYSTMWIYWAVFNYVNILSCIQAEIWVSRERTYTVRFHIIYNGHNARLMHDHVTVLSFTLITIAVHQNFRLLVWHWLLLSSRELQFAYHVLIPNFWATVQSVLHTMRKDLLLRNTEYVERWYCYLFIYRLYIFLHDLTG